MYRLSAGTGLRLRFVSDLSLLDRLLAAASSVSEVTAVRRVVPCESVQLLIYSWKLGLYPVAFNAVAGKRYKAFPAYEYTVEARMPWSRGEELALTLKSRLLDRQIAYEQARLRFLLTLPQEYSASPSAALLRASESPEVAFTDEPVSAKEGTLSPKELAEALPAPTAAAMPTALPAQHSEVGDLANDDEKKGLLEGGDLARLQGAPPQADSSKSNSSSGGGKPATVPPRAADAEMVSAHVAPMPWYRTFLGVLAMLLLCVILMFFCFRLCAKRRTDIPASSSRVTVSDTTLGGDQPRGGEKLPERRPTGHNEGYAQVSDVASLRDPDSGSSWWEQDDLEAFAAR
ncbi:uncharacterized protein LOC113147397 [Cyclospora cayetanensis]|uniref:Uncharacterized protein LOC113147397 n=1 Tax=Cyclospora cayetanensis TaxID=88456 RepID=A0A6P6S1F6_9EIME|nr:uncharacterized protein LOC113147397 [Cyclospora cayetanensis]